MASPEKSRFPGYFSEERSEHEIDLRLQHEEIVEEEEEEEEEEPPIDFSCWGFQNEEERNSIQGIANTSPSSSSSSHRSLSPETQALVREEERCYLCMRCILPSAEPFVILPCYDSCRSKFHFLCIVNTFWHFREAELVCPICTDPAYLVPEPYLEHDETWFGAYLKDPAGVGETFSRKIYPILEKTMRNAGLRKGSGSQNFALKTPKGITQYTEFLVQRIRENISEGASTIYNTLSEEDETLSRKTQEREMHLKMYWDATRPTLWFEKEQCDTGDRNAPSVRFMTHVMRDMEVGKLLARGITLREIHLFLAPSFRDLLFMKFSLRDIKVLEKTNQVRALANMYGIGCQELRVVLGSQMTIQNLLSFGWKSETFRTLGIYAHQLCILRLQKDNIPSFHFTMHEWIRDMCLTKTAVKILRIHANDFQQPKGILAQAGWDLEELIGRLGISPEEIVEFRLGNRSTCQRTSGPSCHRPSGPIPTPVHKINVHPPGIMSYANVAKKKNIVPKAEFRASGETKSPLVPKSELRVVRNRALDPRGSEKGQRIPKGASPKIQNESRSLVRCGVRIPERSRSAGSMQSHRHEKRLCLPEGANLSWRTKPTLRRDTSRKMNGVLPICSRGRQGPFPRRGVVRRV